MRRTYVIYHLDSDDELMGVRFRDFPFPFLIYPLMGVRF